MRNFTLENDLFMDKLTHQAVHMDQGVAYCPEFLATRKMIHYPSRVAQIARAIYKEEMEPSDYSSDIIFSSILSGQGERWQNFGENQNDFNLSMFLAREMMVKKGFKKEEIDKLKREIELNNNHIMPIDDKATKKWSKCITADSSSDICLLIDDATFNYTYKYASKVGDFLDKKNIVVNENVGPYFIGYEYFTSGLIEEGINNITKLVRELEEKSIRKVITLSGQSEYVLTSLLDILQIEHDLEIISILDLCEQIEGSKSYVYGGSFYNRYLNKGNRINQLVKNNQEELSLNSWEFVPVIKGDKRVNKANIWSQPICPEFKNVTGNKELEKKIYNLAIKEIQKSGLSNIIVFDPHAYKSLKNNGYDKNKIIYFTSLIK